MAESVAIMRALADENALRVFAQVVASTGTGLPQRSNCSISFHYVTAHGVSHATGLSLDAVLDALRRLTDAHLTIEQADGRGWRTDFEALRHAAEMDGHAETSNRLSQRVRAD
ncbi:MAG: hypothetical protein ACYCXW_19420 [Solirubrobacteraceae bacterium]